MEQLDRFDIAVVLPCYGVERQIEATLRAVPDFVRFVIVVDDASPDGTGKVVERVAASDPRLHVVVHERNRGVGGAMITGFRKAIELGAQVVVKVDGDGQMDPRDIPLLIGPLVRGAADYTKGNRFRDFGALRRMPPVRRAGNMVLGFLVKAATGYWRIFDPTNGFVAIRTEVLSALPLEKIDRTYFFETSMLGHLYLLDAVVLDVPIPARYGTETSGLSVLRVIRDFPARLLATFTRRIVLKKFVFDFRMESVELLTGGCMLLVGLLYGGINWIRYYRAGMPAPTGTVVIPAMLIILGFQLLLAALNGDLQETPRDPLCRALEPRRENGASA